MPWDAIDDVHIEPVPNAGDDKKARWLINLGIHGESPIRIDSVDVRGAADVEHKTREFLAVLAAVHKQLASRGAAVRYRLGTRRLIVIAWRIALIMVVGTGLLAGYAGVYFGEIEMMIYAGVFVVFGIAGLMMLKGKGGPVAYDPAKLLATLSKPERSA